jgi:hypothetical protein
MRPIPDRNTGDTEMALLRLLPALLIIGGVIGCGRGPSTPVVSPDGTLEFVPDTSNGLVIVIRSRNGDEHFRWNTEASSLQGWSVPWKDHRTLLLSSADIGAYTLEQMPHSTWREAQLGGVFSPDGASIVQTSCESSSTRKLEIWFGAVSGRRRYEFHDRFVTDLVVAEPFHCARWDGNNRVIVTTTDGDRAWTKQKDKTWTRDD